MALNTTQTQGRLGNDPELRYTTTGKAILNFSIAVNNGKETNWIPVVAWEKRAEFITEHFKKGSEIIIEGSLQVNKWEKDGVKHNDLQVLCNKIHFPAKPKNEGQSQTKQFRQSNDTGYGADQCPDDDVPF